MNAIVSWNEGQPLGLSLALQTRARRQRVDSRQLTLDLPLTELNTIEDSIGASKSVPSQRLPRPALRRSTIATDADDSHAYTFVSNMSDERGNDSQQEIAEWSGYVTTVFDDTFEARLEGLSGAGIVGQLEEATIPKSEISYGADLLSVGALFRLCVVRVAIRAGETALQTKIVFRRMPAYRELDLEAARTKASERFKRISLE